MRDIPAPSPRRGCGIITCRREGDVMHLDDLYREIRDGSYDPPNGTYEADRKEHSRLRSEGMERFRVDLLDCLCVAGHPKADVLWRLAWERGHSNGYEEVLTEAMDLIELMELMDVEGGSFEDAVSSRF